MEYGNFLIEIYEHANNHKITTTAGDKKYFYSPIALLDHKSAVSKFNKVTKQSEMRFRIEMWNDKVQSEVVKHLKEIVGQEILTNKVRVIPLEKVILTSKRPTVDYSLYPEWTNYDKSKTLWFSLLCYDQEVCDELAEEMQSDPTQFDHLKLLYSLSSQTSQTKQTTITIDSVTSGQMVTSLLQKFGDKKEVFLTANDEKKMLTETATNIRMDTFDDSEVGSPDTESHILNILKDLLITSRMTIKEPSEKMWDSVFWNEDNYRPDKTTKTLNEIINKLDMETQKKLADMFQKAEKQSEIIEKLASSNKDAEKSQEEQTRRVNQSKDANLNETSRSKATEEEQFSRNQIADGNSKTNEVDTEVSGQGYGFSGSAKVGVENSNSQNTERQSEMSENAKKSLNRYARNLENKERMQHKYDSNSWADVDRISSAISEKLANNSDSSRRDEILKEDVEKLLQESRGHVQWDGDKFVPKPMQLSRINLGKFRDSQSFQDRNVRVRYTNAELSAPIKFVEHAELTVTDEWNHLKDELKDMRELLNTTLMNLAKTNTELSVVRSVVNNQLEAITGTKQELLKSKSELEKTREDFNMTIYDVSLKLNATEKELNEMKISVENLSMEFKENSQWFSDQKGTESNLREELKATSGQLETITTDLATTRTDLSSTNSAVVYLIAKLKARTSEIVDIGSMPTNCKDLDRMGHQLSGFFLVKGSEKMEIVYCDFYPNENDLQKLIGYADVKSAPIYFYVQKNVSFDTYGTPIPFDFARVNQGNAMNLTSGTFTAPLPGIYFFSFGGMAQFSSSNSSAYLEVALHLNGEKIGFALVEEENVVSHQYSQLTLQSTLNLKKDDRVWVEITSIRNSFLLNNQKHYTYITCFMLEEEIVGSL
ncbi:uncharacterized protein LOC124342588 isoform X5 [Daphnia pulicaria]|nr:uncharacterized protein LOC124342588 isoform X5 [Daphnia pulicaria]XP_046651568.1 uncharacterized protein LOC124342588 isoform X5 [Daphnia pulicaria]XP_046651569.1 uncharacterized protein LOC124342588 isoform X5 [Daphnia pulicaria]